MSHRYLRFDMTSMFRIQSRNLESPCSLGGFTRSLFPGNKGIRRSFSVVEIVYCPLAGLDKNIYSCCSTIDYKFTQAVVWRNGISPIVSVAERGPRVRVIHGRLRIDVGFCGCYTIYGMRSSHTFRTQCNCHSSFGHRAFPNKRGAYRQIFGIHQRERLTPPHDRSLPGQPMARKRSAGDTYSSSMHVFSSVCVMAGGGKPRAWATRRRVDLLPRRFFISGTTVTQELNP